MMTTRPTTVSGSPSFATSKSPIGAIPALSTSPATATFVEVPSTVIVPPSTAANESGMR